MRSSLVEAIE